MKTLMKFLAVVVLLIFALVYFSSNSQKTPPANASTSTAATVPSIAVNAKALLAAYKQNEIAANRSYKDQPLSVTARISSIEAGLGDRPYLLLSTGSDFEFNSPQAHMDEGYDDEIAELKKGQQVILHCRGNGEVAGTPMLADCVLAK